MKFLLQAKGEVEKVEAQSLKDLEVFKNCLK